MILGALVVADSQPELMRAMLAPAIAAIPTGLKAYQPDGVYPEGPSYWSYGSTYSVLLLAALRQHRLGDWGIGSTPGFMRSALFYAHSVGPSGKHFNFADGGEGQELAAALVWMARELQQPVLLDAKRALIRQKNGSNDRFATLSALWWPAQRDSAEALETQFAGQGAQPLSFWRSSWQDRMHCGLPSRVAVLHTAMRTWMRAVFVWTGRDCAGRRIWGCRIIRVWNPEASIYGTTSNNHRAGKSSACPPRPITR
jgi:hypothetical protein